MADVSTPKWLLIALVVLSALGGMYLFGSNKSAEQLATYKAQFTKYQDSVVTPTVRLSDSMKKAIMDSTHKIDSLLNTSHARDIDIALLKQNNAKLHAQYDSATKVIVATAPDTCKTYLDSLIIHNSIETEHLNIIIAKSDSVHVIDAVAINTLRSSLDIASHRADTLETALARIPIPPSPKKFLGIKFFPTISPEAAAGGGGILGAVLWAVLHK